MRIRYAGRYFAKLRLVSDIMKYSPDEFAARAATLDDPDLATTHKSLRRVHCRVPCLGTGWSAGISGYFAESPPVQNRSEITPKDLTSRMPTNGAEWRSRKSGVGLSQKEPAEQNHRTVRKPSDNSVALR